VKASQSSPSVLVPSLAIRQREGKAGGGKGLLISEEMSLTLLNANEQMIVQHDDDHDVLRRLVPIETERLMGWLDDWTRYAADGSEISDTQRFKMCGNGVASPVARWIGEHLMPILSDS
jgi:DNA (cytosine-5)-methyltransferase 1